MPKARPCEIPRLCLCKLGIPMWPSSVEYGSIVSDGALSVSADWEDVVWILLQVREKTGSLYADLVSILRSLRAEPHASM